MRDSKSVQYSTVQYSTVTNKERKTCNVLLVHYTYSYVRNSHVM